MQEKDAEKDAREGTVEATPKGNCRSNTERGFIVYIVNFF
jgi:hypothetical protein